MKKSIILLSGGLDSLVSLGIKKDELNIDLALTFDYGQKSLLAEIESSKNICKYYNIRHEIIKLDWLKNITNTALVSNADIPIGTEFRDFDDKSKNVWVPNRNGLFLNIAGCYADSYKYDYILIGANKEEAANFSDNTPEFIEHVNNEFEYSTQIHPKVIAPLINCDKNDIVMLALREKIPLELVRSCYGFGSLHCGKCESCIRLKHALKYNHADKYIKILFG